MHVLGHEERSRPHASRLVTQHLECWGSTCVSQRERSAANPLNCAAVITEYGIH